MTEPGDVAARDWARATGYAVVDGEPLPDTVVAAYQAAHQGPAPPQVDLSAWSAPRDLRPVPPPPTPPPTPAPTGLPPRARRPRARGKRDRFAVASLAAALLPLSGGIMAIVFGLVALLRIRKSRKRGRGMAITGIVLGTCWVVAITLVVARYRAERGPDGAVTSRGGVLVQELRAGDCLASPPGRRGVEVVPCHEPHVSEVYASIPLEVNRFPGNREVAGFAESVCPPALAVHVIPGMPEIETSYLVPSSVSWRLSHRHVLCLLSGRDGTILPGGSIAGL